MQEVNAAMVRPGAVGRGAQARPGRWFAALMALVLLLLCMLTLLHLHRLRQSLESLRSAQVGVSALDLNSDIERSLRIGMPLRDNAQLQVMLDRARRQNPSIVSLHLVELGQGVGVERWRSGAPWDDRPALARALAGKKDPVSLGQDVHGNQMLAWRVSDDLGQVVAAMVVVVDGDDLRAAMRTAARQLAYAAAAAAMGLALVLGLGLRRAWPALVSGTTADLAHQSVRAKDGARVVADEPDRRGMRKLATWVLVSCVTAAFALTAFSLHEFKTLLLPRVMAKAQMVGLSVRATLDNAVQLGVPFEALVGMPEYLQALRADHPEVADIAITRPAVQSDQRKGFLREGYRALGAGADLVTGTGLVTVTLPAVRDGVGVAIAIRATYVDEKLLGMAADAVIVLIVFMAIDLEVAAYFIRRWAVAPVQPRVRHGWASGGHEASATLATTATADDVRLSIFLFVLAEELLRAFFPLYVQGFAQNAWGMDLQWVVAAPLMVYIAVAGSMTLAGAPFIDRLGIRRAIAISVCLLAASFVGLAVVGALWQVLLLRAASATAYAIATVAFQAYINRCVLATKSTGRGLTVFVGAVTAACVCGAPIGAALADGLGAQSALYCAALLAASAWWALPTGWARQPLFLAVRRDAGALAPGRDLAAGFIALLRQRRILMLLVAAVIPGKLLLAGVLFYATPLLLQQYGLSQAAIGQFFMIFYATLMLGNALLSRFGGGTRRQLQLIAMGGLISGGGCMALWLWHSPLALAITILCIGVGQFMVQSPATAVLFEVLRQDAPGASATQAISLFRAVERGGSLLGATVAAGLVVPAGLQGAAVVMGAIALLMCSVSWALLRDEARRPAGSP